MQTEKMDPLLTAGNLLAKLIQILLGIGMAIIAVALPIILLSYKHVDQALIENGGTASLPTVLFAIAAMLVAAITAMAIGFRFFQLLGRIIGTVKESDPFIAINAERLSHMGWLALAVQFIAIPTTALVVFLAAQFPQENIEWDIDFSLTGVLLAIVLFILARVFRHGAEMRDDLEGTV